MLENVTIIIPAHNRPERLQRLLQYYSHTQARLLVPDSSDKIYHGLIPDERQVIYRHYPRMHFLKKIRAVMDDIATEYVMYCADDDFAVPEGIREVTEFLDNHPDYSIAQGHYLTFTPDKNGKVKFYPRYIRNFDCRITADSPVQRMHDECGMYASMLYGVTRSDIFRRMYSYCFDSEGELRFQNLFLAEEYFNHSVLIAGKYATIPTFFSARERIKGSATETTVPLSIIKNAPQYAQEYAGFRGALALQLSDCTDMPYQDAYDEITRISRAPIDKPSIMFKRKVNAFIGRHRLLRPAVALSEARYHRKGFKAVQGMKSYPCFDDTPAKRDILKALGK